MPKSNYNPTQGKLFANTHRIARNQDGDTEATLAEKIILFLRTKGYDVWRQNNTGVLNANNASEKITKMIAIITQNITNALRQNPNRNVTIDEKELQQDIYALIQKSYMKASLGVRGVPDVIGFNLKSGNWIAVEIKINNDDLSIYQKEFIKRLKDAGGECYIAKTYDQFKNSWENRNA